MFGLGLPNTVQFHRGGANQQVLIKSFPVKMSLASAYYFEGIRVYYAILLLTFEANQLGYVRVSLDIGQLSIYRDSKFNRSKFFFSEIEKSDMVAIKKL